MEVDHWDREQGECDEYQACRARAVLGEPDQGVVPLCMEHDEGAGRLEAASLPYMPIFAALVSIINTKLPQVGELVLHRLISQFCKSFKWNELPLIISDYL